MPRPVLSAIVTCYKDGPAILPMHRRLTEVMKKIGVSFEIIFVNDASPDDADRTLENLTASDGRVLAIEHSRNFGSQSAFLSGLELATGDAVILLDGDLQDPPELIFDFYARWQEGFDVVYGCRKGRAGSWIFSLCARAFYRTFRSLSDVSIPLDAGDFALLNRRVVEQMLLLPETDQFLRGLRAWMGFRQTGVDYVRPKRAFGRSTHSFLRNFWWAKKAIFSFSSQPIEALGYLAVLMTLTSLAALVYQALGFLLHPERELGLGTVALVVAFFGSLQLLASALLGEYLLKVLEEAKGRPKFIRKAIRFGGRQITGRAEIEQFVRARSLEGPRQGDAGWQERTTHGAD